MRQGNARKHTEDRRTDRYALKTLPERIEQIGRDEGHARSTRDAERGCEATRKQGSSVLTRLTHSSAGALEHTPLRTKLKHEVR